MNFERKSDEAYQNLRLIHEGAETLVYRGTRVADGIPVLRKSLRARHPTPEQCARQRHEYNLLTEFDSPSIVSVLSLDTGPNGPVLTLQDEHLASLADRISGQPLPVPEFLDLAQSLVHCLGEIHDHKIVHKDINPGNILWSPEEKRAQIFDFGIASRLTREYSVDTDVRTLEGTLAYIAPEQTGRTNRVIDWRADLYSLGATFYEALSGQAPFQAGDAMGLIHAHLAMQSVPLDELRADIPNALWLLVKTLMAKSADDRYQSTRGIAHDLARIRAALEDGSADGITELTGITVTDRFELPGRLYGRTEELKALTDAYNRALDGRSEIILIQGPAGTGKSALAAELRPVVAQGGGHFVSGKFDRNQRDTPYAPLMQAARSLIRQFLAESDEQMAQWRTRILDAVGTNGALIIESVPELQALIGEAPPLVHLSAVESRNRFNVLLVRFFQSLSTTQHPLTLFVDDVQWADTGSLELIQRLLSHNDTRSFLLIAAFRDNEVTATHPLNNLLDGIAKVGVRCEVLRPKPFDLQDTVAFVSDATHRPATECKELAKVLLSCSGGRPFFLHESLLAAYESQAIKFDPKQSAFDWDLEAIQGQSVSGDLGPLLVKRIGRLPPATRRLLGLASCIGSTFDLEFLAAVDDRPMSLLARELETAFESGLVWSLGSWRFIDDQQEPAEPYASESNHGLCKFVHDEVQAAAYEQVDEDTRIKRHLHIARILDDRTKQSSDSDRIFELVHQVTLALDLITQEEEKLHFAELFLEASRRATESAAFATAAKLVTLGRSLIKGEPWNEHYALWIELSRIGAEAAALSSNKKMLDELVGEVRAHATNVLDQTDVISAQISYFVAHLKPAEALSVAREALTPLGVALPASAKLFDVAVSLARTLWAMRGKSTDVLESLPKMQDPVHLAAMRILLRTISPAYIADPNMFPLIVLHMVRLSLRHGNSVESPFGYVTYGILLSAGLGRLEKATELGRFALNLASADASKMVDAKLAVSFYVTLHHWKNHLSDSLAPLLAGHHAGLETGDIEYACHNAWYYCNYVTWTGETLDEVASIQNKLIAAIDEHNSEFHSVCGRIFNQMVQALSQAEITDETSQRLIGDAFDERTDVDLLIKSNNLTGMFIFHHCRAALSYFLGDFKAARTHGLEAKRFEQSVLGSTNVAQNTFYLALATLHEYRAMNLWQRIKTRRRISSYRRRLRRWGNEGPANYAHKFDMVEGQWHAMHGRGEKAMICFDKARANARSGHFTHDEALAAELLARCQMQLGMQLAAEETLHDAWTAWLSWGGLAMARQLEDEFPYLTEQRSRASTGLATHTSKSISIGGTDNIAIHLDATSALKASQAMMVEIVLDSLLEKLMRILIENAGAQTGALMLNVDGVAHQRAFGDVDRDQYVVIDAVPLHSAAANTNIVQVPLRVVDYVWRSGEVVVLDDAANDPRFGEDPLVRDRSPMSILAAPLEHRGRLVGVIYLENSRTPAAFTEDRVSLIQILAAQAAISIQNASLYKDLEGRANDLSQLNQSLGRFVPSQFLASLGHESVIGVQLGESVHREMSVLFSDIRGFTSLVESLDPNAHVDFINEYLSYMEPAIVEAGGFVDSYIGDAIMALFDSADDAVHAALKMTENLYLLNESRTQSGQLEMRIGIGISTGPITLGTIGGPQRIKCGVIGDTVNLAARVESLTPTYGASLLISHHTKDRLSTKVDFTMRQIERVTVKGQSEPVTLFEVIDAAPDEDRQSKLRVMDDWNAGLEAFYARDFSKASECFGKASSSCSSDLAARRFVSSCWQYLDHGVPDDWDGVVNLDHK